MTDISTWLLGVYDRREKVAREATPGPWRADGNHIFDGEGKKLFARGTHMRPSATEVFALFANMEQVITHDPEKTLARLAALKAIVAGHSPTHCHHPAEGTTHTQCGFCSSGGFPSSEAGSDLMGIEGDWPCPTLRLLAAAESHEPGYRQEWAVEP